MLLIPNNYGENIFPFNANQWETEFVPGNNAPNPNVGIILSVSYH